jgi:hypothetical protein
MNNLSFTKTLVPQLDGRALDFIKISAAVFMVIDHINLMWLNSDSPGMFMVGRATFPLFCYAVAMAMFKAGPDKAPRYGLQKYLPRLLALALVSEIASQIARDTGVLNVIFTLGLGAAIAGFSYRLKDSHLILLGVVSILATGLPEIMEFGTTGIMLPTAILMYMHKRRGGLTLMLCLLYLINMNGYNDALQILNPEALVYILPMTFSATVLPWWVLQWSQKLPQDGRYLHKYALHIFYPGHMLLLWAIARYMMHIGA